MQIETILLPVTLTLCSFISYGQGAFLPMVGEHPTDTISIQHFTEAKNLFARSDQYEVVTYIVSFIDGDSLMELRVNNDSLGAGVIKLIRENKGNVAYRKTYIENIEIKGCDGVIHRAPSRVLMITYPKKH